MTEGRTTLSTALAVGQNAKEREYWRQKLAGYSQKVAFPYDTETVDPGKETTAADTMEARTIIAPDEVYDGLERVAKENPHALHVVLTAAVLLQLNKYTGAEDIVVGTPIYRQKKKGTPINTALAIRTILQPGKNYKNMLMNVKETVVEAIANQNFPLWELAEKDMEIEEAGTGEKNFPLFDTAVVLENIQDKTYLNHLKLNLLMVYRIEERNPGKRLQLQVDYNPARYREETVRRIITHHIQLLKEIVAPGGMDEPVKRLAMQSNESKRRILEEFSGRRNLRKNDNTVHRLFEEQVMKTPHRIAVVGGRRGTGAQEQQVTYRELNRKANRLASQLRRKGVRKETVVGIMVERTPAQVAAILGIIKAGGAYLPLDPDYPVERLLYMLKDSRTRHLVADYTVSRLKRMAEVEDILEINSLIIGNPVDDDQQNIIGRETAQLEEKQPPVQPDNLVYVMYTSGSTGKPRGVMVEHRSVVRLVKDTGYIRFDERDRILQTGALSFDASTFEIWGALVNGLSLYQAAKEDILDPNRLNRWLKEWQITIMWMTSALYNRMSQAESDIFTGLRRLLVGGDVLSPANIHRIREQCPGLKILNGYGPTENTTFSTVYNIENDGKHPDNSDIPIGTPITGTTAYIVDPYGNPQPEGVDGELVVGGEGVARGYLNKPTLTAEVFIRSPFPGDRSTLYITGDRALWLYDGNIRFRGRKDQQVKIRGFRIEPGEIENRLIEHHAVKEAVVIDINREAGEKFLAAYVVPKEPKKNIDENEIKEYLHHRLPDYMIPAKIITIPEIPLTPNKKVDRTALPKPENTTEKIVNPPETEIEKKLVDIWAQVLDIDKNQIGTADDFLGLGGHSLKAASLTAMIKKEMGVEVSLTDMFTGATVRKLAKAIEDAEQISYKTIRPAEEKEYYPQTPQQKRLYILQQMDNDSMTYNMPMIMEVEGKLDTKKLQDAFKAMIKRHESLRTSFFTIDGQPVQRIHTPEEIPFILHNTDNTQREKNEIDIIRTFIRPFRLDRPPLLRGELVKTGPGTGLLMFDMHHIITDGTSQGILIRELLRQYDGNRLQPQLHQYKDYAQWWSNESRTDTIKKQENHWLNRFTGATPVLMLPEDKPRPEIRDAAGNHIGFQVQRDKTKKLLRIAEEGNASLFMVLLMVANVMLAKLTGQEDIVIGTPVAGRRHADQENIIGMFVNTLALRSKPAGEKKIRDFLNEIRQNTLLDFENQEYPFEELVMKANVPRDTSRNPLFDVMLALQNQQRAGGSEIKGVRLKPYTFEHKTAKFDLNFDVFEVVGKLSCILEYSTAIYEETTARRYTGYYKRIIDEITTPGGMDKTICEIEILSEEEKRQLMEQANGPRLKQENQMTVMELFKRQVDKTPDRIAVEDERALTYRELNRRADILANRLKQEGIGPDKIVALEMNPSIERIIAIWGILNAGGAYLPIEPGTPEERIKYMLKDSNAEIVIKKYETNLNDQNLNDQNTNDRNEPNRPRVLNYDHMDFEIVYSLRNIEHRASKLTSSISSLAYIIYTSGSTGRPKGVMVEHRNLASYVTAFEREFNQTPGDRMLQQASYTFDAYVEEHYPAQLKGGRLVIPKPAVIKDTEALCTFMERRQITMITASPMLLAQLNRRMKNSEPPENNTLRSVTVYISGGDRLEPAHIDKLVKKGTVYNTYGPTEATVCAAYYKCDPGAEPPQNVPIGKPITNYTVRIMDKNLRQTPVGVAGELCIAGPGVARGYQNRPELTAERFIKSKNECLYRSGDRVRWLPCGNIQFLGRLDRQVKIRGYRIELGEVESVLNRLEGIKEAVVNTGTDSNGEKYLCGYYIPEEHAGDKITVNHLRRRLARKLPEYMIPARYRQMERFPRTAGNKIDRNALPQPETHRPQMDTMYRAPQGRIEKQVADIMKKELNLDEIGVDDNFFDLGGNSLTMLNVNNKMKEQMGIDIPVMMMFQYTTIKTLAAGLQNGLNDNTAASTNNKAQHRDKQHEKEKHDKNKNRLKSIRKKVKK